MTSKPAQRFTGRAIVGLDLDGVCGDYTAGFRPYAASYLGVDPADLPDPQTYNLVNAGWGFADIQGYLDAHRTAVKDGLYAKMPAIEGISEAAHKLSEAGAHIRIVTHRLILGGSHRQVVSETAEWLDAHRIPYMSLCFTGLKDSVGAHVYVEDSPSNIDLLRDHDWDTFVFDQPYNQAVAGPRINDWEEGADIIIQKLRDIGQIT